MSKHLHVISFDNPFPPNYGGVIDVYYKLEALKNAGVQIILHIFEYGREKAPELEKICQQVHYYPRRTFVNPFVGSLPYIVSTRNNANLLQNLLQQPYPILFEGLHSCFFLHEPSLKDRVKLVRMHNIEHDYYRKLEEVEGNFFKKYFFAKEADRLEKFEQTLQHATCIFAISPNDEKNLKERYKQVVLLPAFHANHEVTAQPGQGEYAFYHGKLSVGENDEAARFLVAKVFNDINVPLIIAGSNPSGLLKKLVEQHTNVTLLEHATTQEIGELTRNAQINVLPTFQCTGIKLKLINVLYQGRWTIANELMVRNTGLAELCEVTHDANEMKKAVLNYMNIPFNQQHIEQRLVVLQKQFSNANNIQHLLNYL